VGSYVGSEILIPFYFLARVHLIDVPQQLEIFAEVLERTDAIGVSDKCDYTQAIRTTASIQMTMHMSDIESIGNLFEGKEQRRFKAHLMLL
jgi:hypothetical protein